jgi:hypothetical protein
MINVPLADELARHRLCGAGLSHFVRAAVVKFFDGNKCPRPIGADHLEKAHGHIEVGLKFVFYRLVDFDSLLG